MKYEEFFTDNKYKNSNDKNKILIDSILKIFEEKCTKEFYPAWRNDEGNVKVFAIKLKEKLMSKYGSKRENIVTIRLRMEQLDIEVFRGTYCKNEEFPYSLDTIESDLARLYEDINNLFASGLITFKN
ncbi:hypothetical protein HMPREF1982_00789 [Clostridiales bacterium oral taxon 876 str. F0540]|nr:hypothetical protein HMPREF1982_00789 [Clostridiales bacterium oral taxon 876 str. F0540]